MPHNSLTGPNTYNATPSFLSKPRDMHVHWGLSWDIPVDNNPSSCHRYISWINEVRDMVYFGGKTKIVLEPFPQRQPYGPCHSCKAHHLHLEICLLLAYLPELGMRTMSPVYGSAGAGPSSRATPTPTPTPRGTAFDHSGDVSPTPTPRDTGILASRVGHAYSGGRGGRDQLQLQAQLIAQRMTPRAYPARPPAPAPANISDLWPTPLGAPLELPTPAPRPSPASGLGLGLVRPIPRQAADSLPPAQSGRSARSRITITRLLNSPPLPARSRIALPGLLNPAPIQPTQPTQPHATWATQPMQPVSSHPGRLTAISHTGLRDQGTQVHHRVHWEGGYLCHWRCCHL
jgi:hypothetical protein